MIRTQVYLHKDQVQQIAFYARKHKKAKAKVFRDLIQKGIEAQRDKQTVGTGLLELVEAGKKLGLHGPKNLSTNHDEILYGEK